MSSSGKSLASGPGHLDYPLCVDLDGTFLSTDSLHEALLHILRHKPLQILSLLPALLRGKAAFKQAVTRMAGLDPALLPVNEPLAAYIRAQRAAGREIALVSAADKHFVAEVAARHDMFDHAEGSDGSTNLAGAAKLKAIQARYGSDFVYAGDANVDLPIWKSARAAIVVGNDSRLARKVASLTPIEVQFPSLGSYAKSWLQELRIHQWAKNSLLFVPFVLAGPLATAQDFLEALLGFLIFGLFASSGYVVNDLLDLESDRRHRTKKDRPFAAGRLPISHGVVCVAGFLLLACALCLLLPPAFFLAAIGYFAGTLFYSFVLKRIAVVDVIALGGLFTVRIVAGALLLADPISLWLLSFSMFIFSSLAIVKRYTELHEAQKAGVTELHGRGYIVAELPMLLATGVASSVAATVIFLIYLIDERFPSGLYTHPNWLWLIFPLLLIWTMRVWRLTVLGRMNEDPVLFAIKDRFSLVLGVLVLLLIVLAR